jgi:hypothetical protein
MPRGALPGLLAALSLWLVSALATSGRAPAPIPCTVTVTLGQRPLHRFVPSHALGAGIDGHEQGDIDRIFTPGNLRAMETAGFQSLTYRLRTELGIEAWHWNPRGAWSDPAHRRGYWTSDTTPAQPIEVSYGYRLPRRGSTVDQANNDGYSRLDDGDPRSFWKSNPYLDPRSTGEPGSRHPQWVVIDLGAPRRVNALRILWGTPYAAAYRVEYCADPWARDLEAGVAGEWRTFSGGRVTAGRGGEARLRLCGTPVSTRFLRVLMTVASGAAPAGTADPRDGMGFAIRELYAGVETASGGFRDLVRHGASSGTQTVTVASSTDPWHRELDRDPKIEQPGFDRVLRSGLTHGRPLLTPVGVLFDTPENAAAELTYLRARGCPVQRVEMGEEPDGQYVMAEDYGALYLQFAAALHRVQADVQTGGPCFQMTMTDPKDWPDPRTSRPWLQRFLAYLRERGRVRELGFFSFEWYPFDDVCAPTAPQLARAPAMLRGVLERWQQYGLPRGLPRLLTEYGYSAFAGEAEVDVAGALLNADVAGTFLETGGDAAYLFGYEPNALIKESDACDAWGNNTLFLADDAGQVKHRVATFYGAQLLTQQWAQPGDGLHDLYRARSDARDARGEALVTSYAVRRPDGRWALLLVNKDPVHARAAALRFRNQGGAPAVGLRGSVEVFQFGRAQYAWHAQGPHGYPTRSLPPARTTVPAGAPVVLPPYSLTVVRGEGPEPPARRDGVE